MNTCKTCKYWNVNPELAHRKWFECVKTLTYMEIPSDLGTLAVVDARPIPDVAILRTNEDFGCNQHEAKEAATND